MGRIHYRCRYEKLGAIRFTSHRDMIRTFMRALRMAELPVVYTEGYHQRPRLAFSPPLKTGHESLAEYLDLVLAEPVPDLADRLNRTLPDGIRFTEVCRLDGAAQPLSSSVVAAEYRVPLERWRTEGWWPPGWDSGPSMEAGLAERCRGILASDPVVDRHGKHGVRRIHVRKGIYELGIMDGGKVEASLRMILAAGGDVHIQPGEVLQALIPASSEDVRAIPVVRWELFTSRDGDRPLSTHPPTD